MEQDMFSQTALDQMVSNDQTQMLKAAVPYFPPADREFCLSMQKYRSLSIPSLFFPRRIKKCRYVRQKPLIPWT